MESYGGENLSAPVRVYPPGGPTADNARSGFQLVQSRAGIKINPHESLSGTLEVDFIDFDKASPVTKALPRLRLASIHYQASESNWFEIGQDWDVFSPAKPHTFNYVGLYFGSGNAGFIRPQLKWGHRAGAIETQFAIGAPSNNPNPHDSDIELGAIPSFSGSLSYSPGEGARVGASAIGGRLRFTSGADHNFAAFYGANGFAEFKIGESGEVHAEMYYGQNMGNVGLLTLGLGSFSESIHEVGGYLTYKTALTPDLSAQLGVGHARVTEGAGSVLKGITDYRVRDNTRVAASLAYALGATVNIFCEVAGYDTGFTEIDSGAPRRLGAFVVDTGAVMTF